VTGKLSDAGVKKVGWGGGSEDGRSPPSPP
jgi:hypothetical protein